MRIVRVLVGAMAATGLFLLASPDAAAHGGTHPTPFPTGKPGSKPSAPGKGSAGFTKGIRSKRWENPQGAPVARQCR